MSLRVGEPAPPEPRAAGRIRAEAAANQEAVRQLEAEPKLELLTFSWSQESGVQAMAIFNDASGAFITSNDSYVDYQPILPGQSSPFTVMERWNPAMKSARIEFKALDAQIPTKDSRKK